MTKTVDEIISGIISHIDEHGLDDILEHYDQEMVEAVLEHAGVKGMRWGVRKRSSKGSVKITSSTSGKSAEIKINPKKTTVDASSGTISTSSKREAKSISSQIKKNKVKMMSDDELKTRINRLKLEQEYKKLTVAQRSPGQKLVREILAETGKSALKEIAAESLKPHIKQAMLGVGAKAATSVAKSALK